MEPLDWKKYLEKCEELGRSAKVRGDEQNALVYESLGEVTELLGHAITRLAHAEERLGFLSRQVADLESRVHENVE